MANQVIGGVPDGAEITGLREEQAKGNQKDERQQERILGDGLSAVVCGQAHLLGCPQGPHFLGRQVTF